MSILKNYIFPPHGEQITLKPVVSLLIDRMGDYAVQNDPQELEALQSELYDLRASIDGELPPASVMVLVESATHVVEAYNNRITQAIVANRSDFEGIVETLKDTMLKVVGESTESGRRLKKIGDQLVSGGAIKDLKALKLHLKECVSSFQDESLRQKAESDAMILKLREIIERSGVSSEPLIGSHPDPATGLLRREDGIAAIHQALESGRRKFLVVMVINRVQPINARFGHGAGDRMLCGFKEYIEKQLRKTDQLFRWTGPALVAIIERAEPLDSVRVEMRHALDVRLEEDYTASGRSVLIPISAAWSIFPLQSSVHEAEAQISKFIAGQGPRDYA